MATGPLHRKLQRVSQRVRANLADAIGNRFCVPWHPYVPKPIAFDTVLGSSETPVSLRGLANGTSGSSGSSGSPVSLRAPVNRV